VAVSVLAVDDEVRIRRGDGAVARARGRVVSVMGGEVALVALRGETVAFQVIVLAGERALADATLTLPDLTPSDGSAPGPRRLRPDVFRELYLPVKQRSRSRSRPSESLGWEAEARPPDEQMLGDVPDALLPIDIDAAPVALAPAVPAGQTAAFWIDVPVPQEAAPGDYAAEAQVRSGDAALARFTVNLTVRPPVLPYRATGAFVFYEPTRLERRIGNGEAVERQLWQLLHAHHLDALAPLSTAADIRRLAAAYDGSLFREAAGYRGPGAGVPPSVVALGAYGVLGAPQAESLARVDAMLGALPASISDVFLYAVDEQCRSPRASEWKNALAAHPHPTAAGVRVGQTCDDPPAQQASDITLISAQAFARETPQAARAAGRRAWIYNGELPRTGTLLLDADPRGLIADGWIAAALGIERWFYWESTFWDDDNAGGQGAVDPFATAENFHNNHGDAALGDGLLLYPGRQLGSFAAHSLGVAVVLPSLRLKALRRGIQDAGLIALAAREKPDEVAHLVARALPAALDEAPMDAPPSWERGGLSFTAARTALRALITQVAPLSLAEVHAAFDTLAASRRQTIPLAPTRRPHHLRRVAIAAATIAVIVVLTALAWTRRRRRATS
jgi:hypothetical protein